MSDIEMTTDEPTYARTSTWKRSTYKNLLAVLNGPIVAGVGASVDPGLPRGEFHALPWNTAEKVLVKIVESSGNMPVELEADTRNKWQVIDNEEVFKIAKFNVDTIFNFEESIVSKFHIEQHHQISLYKDMICVLCIMISLNYHYAETREMTETEKRLTREYAITADDRDLFTNTMHFDRAATFLMSRVHTKYQTNHAVGGNPVQASIAASIRAYYGLTPGMAKTSEGQMLMAAVVRGIYWCTHPANEALLLPSVIKNTKIKGAYVPRAGPLPCYLPAEEYFDIRADTAPASTHHFLVAAAAIKAIKPFGLLRLLPEPGRLVEVEDGLKLIRDYGAALHPAARYWGLNKQAAGQKSVEPLCADLGYAVKKLLPNSSLKDSPILKKEDMLNGAWKTVIDGIRIELDKSQEMIVSSKVLQLITSRIAPKINKEPSTERIFRLMSSSTKAKKSKANVVEVDSSDQDDGDFVMDDGEDDDDDSEGGDNDNAGDDDSDNEGPVAMSSRRQKTPKRDIKGKRNIIDPSTQTPKRRATRSTNIDNLAE